MQLHEAIMHIRSIGEEAGVYREQGPARLERLHTIVCPVYADLEEDSCLGFTNGHDPAHDPSPSTPAYVTLHTGVTNGQLRLAYAYLAAWSLIDARGCSVPLPPQSVTEASALSEDEANAWRLAMALLLPPTTRLTDLPLSEIADRFSVPEPLVAIYANAVRN